MKQLISILFIFTFFSPALFGDAIRLSGGQVIEGTILEEQDNVILFESATGTFSFEKRDILEIERDGDDFKIARLPENDMDPLMGAAFSFIPGYSGLYSTKRPELGIPFAMVDLYFFTSALDQLSLRSQVPYFKSDYFKNYFLGKDPYLTLFTSNRLTEVNDGLLTFGSEWNKEVLLHYMLYQSSEKEYDLISGKRISKNEMSRNGNNHMRLWLSYSALNAVVSYLALEFKPSFIVDATDSEGFNHGRKDRVAIFPLVAPTSDGDGMNLGMVLFF